MSHEDHPAGHVIAFTGSRLSGKTTSASRLKGHVANLGMGVSVGLYDANRTYRSRINGRVVESTAVATTVSHPDVLAVTILDNLQSYEDTRLLQQTFGSRFHLYNLMADNDVREERLRQLLEKESTALGRLVAAASIGSLDMPQLYLADIMTPRPIDLTNNTRQDLSDNVKFITDSLLTSSLSV